MPTHRAREHVMADGNTDFREIAGEQGASFDGSDPEALRLAIELACDYRGDVTITRRSTGESIEGYVYDRAAGTTTSAARIRIIPGHGGDRLTIPCDDIARIDFTGRDTAAGKSFETWMKRYVRKKLAGEEASVRPEPLDEP